MRYAVPLSGGRLASHFGHCEQFALIDIDITTKTIMGKEVVDSPGHQPGFLPGWLAEAGVTAVIAGGMGSRAQALFQENRIDVITGAPNGNPENIVLAHIQGTLVTGDNVCDH